MLHINIIQQQLFPKKQNSSSRNYRNTPFKGVEYILITGKANPGNKYLMDKDSLVFKKATAKESTKVIKKQKAIVCFRYETIKY